MKTIRYGEYEITVFKGSVRARQWFYKWLAHGSSSWNARGPFLTKTEAIAKAKLEIDRLTCSTNTRIINEAKAKLEITGTNARIINEGFAGSEL